jgi:hypothetical protein
MHFGEYELSPSLISLSPLPSVHWNTFQRIPIRTSSWCYPTFILTKGRSLGFASTHSDYTALLRLAFASAPDLKSLTLPEKVTRRFIMQKARRHNQKIAPTACRQTVSGTISLLCSRCFSPFLHSTGSLSVSREYLALRDGPRWFTQNFSCSALLRIPLGFIKESYTGLSPSTAVFSKTFYFLNRLPWRGPTTPILPKQHRFGLFRVRSPLLAESLLFSSPMGT